jgi:hypothetical protein
MQFGLISTLLLAIPACVAQIGGLGGVQGASMMGGPGLNSRSSGSNIGSRAGSQGIRVMLGGGAMFDSGLTASVIQSDGTPVRAVVGAQAVAGLYLNKRIRRGVVGLDYMADWRTFTKEVGQAGVDHLLQGHAGRQLSRSAAIELTGALGTSNRPLNGFVLANNGDTGLSQLFAPTSEVVNLRTFFGSAQGALSLQRGAKLGLQLQGGAFAVRRRSSLLTDIDGLTSGATASYRLSRRTTIGTAYQFQKFSYPNVFGDSYLNSLGVELGRTIGRNWNLAVSAGAVRVESQSIQRTPVDPIIRDLFGLTDTLEVVYRLNTLPNFRVTVGRKIMRSSNLDLYASTGVQPGNGIIFLARQNQAGANYSYNNGRWSTFFNGAWNESTGLFLVEGKISQFFGSGGMAYLLGRNLNMTLTATGRRITSQSLNNFNADGWNVAMALVWSPGGDVISMR